MSDLQEIDTQIEKNLSNLRSQIERCAEKFGRSTAEIRLIGVCKFQPIERIRAALQHSLRDLGQNYVQELVRQREEIAQGFPDTQWHFVGRLQRNKVKGLLQNTVPKPPLIHTLDSLKLAEEIHRRAKQLETTVTCFLQVKLDEDPDRGGLVPSEVLPLLEKIKPLDRIKICGLMVLPPLEEDLKDTRKHFAFVRDLQTSLRKDISKWDCDHIQLGYLSMGMSDDFEMAIAEGATHIRIGTSVFGERVKT